MKRFLINIVAFVVIVVVAEKAVFYFLQSQRPVDYRAFLNSKKQFFNERIDYDLVVIGDSHAAEAIDPRVVERLSGKKTFNLSVFHASPYENYFVSQAMVKYMAKAPQWVVLGTNPKMFRRPLIKGKYTPLIIDDIFLLFDLYRFSKNGLEASFLFKSINEKYLFRHCLNKILGKQYHPGRQIRSVYRGYLETVNQRPVFGGDVREWDKEAKVVVEAQKEYFENTVVFLQRQGIQLVIVNPPIWFESLDMLSETTAFKLFQNEICSIGEKYHMATSKNPPLGPC